MNFQILARAVKTRKRWTLRDSSCACICMYMTLVFDIDDRARLRERFYGATFSVLAHL
ncbi:hypothetical protein [Litoreibacter albidus]|uniref:hypothetical protein n=1 Tax=Litoreibacter albidus TaxID=670155 RepID=UPI003736BCBE